MTKLNTHSANLMRRPIKRVKESVESNGDLKRYTLERPRFTRGILAKILLPHLRKTSFKVHLDEIGSFVWERCDGTHTLEEIAEAMDQTFGARVNPAHQRLLLFIRELERGEMIAYIEPNTSI